MVESQDSMYSVGSNELDLNTFNSGDLNLLNVCTPSSDSLPDIDSQTLLSNLSDFPDFNHGMDFLQCQNTEHLRQIPILDEMNDNEWKFDMHLNSDSGNRSSWLYSPSLNKVFVKINTPLNVYPVITRHDPNTPLFIRAMIVYTSQNDLPEPVKKCPNHKEQYSNGQNSDHILRCDNNGSIYTGNENGRVFEEKLSVLIPMRNVASNEPLKLTFTCQNSCSGGMNRKSTTLVFTLEDRNFNILGRKCMHFKVCSCPRRDKEKDEQTTKPLPKKRKHDGNNGPSTSKKVHLLQKQDSNEPPYLADAAVMEAPMNNISGNIMNIKQEQDAQCELKVILPNDQVKKVALRAIYDIIAGEMARNGLSAYNFYLNEIQKQIDDNEML